MAYSRATMEKEIAAIEFLRQQFRQQLVRGELSGFEYAAKDRELLAAQEKCKKRLVMVSLSIADRDKTKQKFFIAYWKKGGMAAIRMYGMWVVVPRNAARAQARVDGRPLAWITDKPELAKALNARGENCFLWRKPPREDREITAQAKKKRVSGVLNPQEAQELDEADESPLLPTGRWVKVTREEGRKFAHDGASVRFVEDGTPLGAAEIFVERENTNVHEGRAVEVQNG